jgi:hypothetical protein
MGWKRDTSMVAIRRLELGDVVRRKNGTRDSLGKVTRFSEQAGVHLVWVKWVDDRFRPNPSPEFESSLVLACATTD